MKTTVDYHSLEHRIMKCEYQVVQKLIDWKFLFWSGSYYVFIIKRNQKFLDNFWCYYIKDHENYESLCWVREPEFNKIKKFKTEESAINFLNYHILKKTDDMNDEYICYTVRQ